MKLESGGCRGTRMIKRGSGEICVMERVSKWDLGRDSLPSSA
jgi:hypothetical protein